MDDVIRRSALATAPMLALAACVGSCRSDGSDPGAGPGPAPVAYPPQSGGPLRRESAAETLRRAEPPPPVEGGVDLGVERRRPAQP